MPRQKGSAKARDELKRFGLAYPGAHPKSPWPGHDDVAVNDKTFCYLSVAGEPFSISCKLPHSSDAALSLPFTKPTGYGLGRSGWVTADFPKGKEPPIALLKEWIDESYRAQAPKRLVKQLDSGEATSAAPKRKSAEPGALKRAATGTKKATAPKKVSTKSGTRKKPGAKKPGTRTRVSKPQSRAAKPASRKATEKGRKARARRAR